MITNASISSESDVDYYKFSAKSGSYGYAIKLEWYKDSSMDIRGIIYDKDKQKIREIYKYSDSYDNSSDKTFYYTDFAVDPSQNCYVKIYNNSPIGTGSYEISIRKR